MLTCDASIAVAAVFFYIFGIFIGMGIRANKEKQDDLDTTDD